MNGQERIEYFKEQIARLSNQVVDLQNERDALAAQVERLTPLARRCIWGALLWNDHNFGDLRGCLKEETHKAGILDIDDANEFLAGTPQQHLAKIRAEAVMRFASFVFAQYESGEYHVTAKEKYRQLNSIPQGQTVSVHNDPEYCGILGNAEKYADKLRNGGE